ncbi:hypothetical protein BJ085DRAFT_30641 [Dimargaris cristalligena]|uniref:Uncharacterized protein n=1 Tax=Dimargaris cristalligena TaxID=215637 RepID=A0A4P9ZLM3_9FUNG|nr:hypothetical protein BJ085DRAFT_30641 [Dimargaris cristalligena]|eukprot:RKP34043.1 hypothetical protein BJ085DRAFT_30641 [Dimargaris cristalligena]
MQLPSHTKTLLIAAATFGTVAHAHPASGHSGSAELSSASSPLVRRTAPNPPALFRRTPKGGRGGGRTGGFMGASGGGTGSDGSLWASFKNWISGNKDKPATP